MTSFSSDGGAGGAHGAQRAQGTNGNGNRCSVFIGSFNINSQDLTIEDARAWLKEATDADIVALGLQVKIRLGCRWMIERHVLYRASASLAFMIHHLGG